METKQTVARTFDDIVFENRNKDYGAYVIRRTYDENVNKAFFITIVSGLFLAIAVFAISSIKTTPPIIHNPLGDLPKIFTQDPKIIPNEKPKRNIAKVKTIPDKVIPRVTTAVVPESVPVTPVETVSSITPVTDEGGTGDFSDDDGTAGGSSLMAALPVEKKADEVFVRVEQMPEFADLGRFLQRNLRYPSHAARVGTEGTVYVSFVINRKGEVTSPEIVRGVSRECDEEAIRVISKMPNWKPGIQNKIPVMVRMVLPIKFSLQNS